MKTRRLSLMFLIPVLCAFLVQAIGLENSFYQMELEQAAALKLPVTLLLERKYSSWQRASLFSPHSPANKFGPFNGVPQDNGDGTEQVHLSMRVSTVNQNQSFMRLSVTALKNGRWPLQALRLMANGHQRWGYTKNPRLGRMCT